MDQPALHPEQIRALYYLKLKLARSMTDLVREAVEVYLRSHGGIENLVPEGKRVPRASHE